jgi:hypothetical protein
MDALEHVIDEALCRELAQALVMLYCRHLSQPEARRTLRLMVLGHPDVTRQFDDLDELHARHPFRELGKDALPAELRMLYRYHLQQPIPGVLRQLRRLGRHDPDLIAAFDGLDREFHQTG